MEISSLRMASRRSLMSDSYSRSVAEGEYRPRCLRLERLATVNARQVLRNYRGFSSRLLLLDVPPVILNLIAESFARLGFDHLALHANEFWKVFSPAFGRGPDLIIADRFLCQGLGFITVEIAEVWDEREHLGFGGTK